MLLELFIILQISGLICFAVGFFRHSEWFLSFAIIIFAALIFASYNIEQNKTVITKQTVAYGTIDIEYDTIIHVNTDKVWSYLNIGLFSLSLLLFFFDIFNNFKENKSVKR